MFQLALRARIPILNARTSDLVYLREVLDFYAGDKMAVQEMRGLSSTARLGLDRDTLYYSTDQWAVDVHDALYEALAQSGSVLVLVNQEVSTPFAFDCGELPVPDKMVRQFLTETAKTKITPELLAATKGLTLKAVTELIRLAQTRYGQLTARGMQALRHELAGALQGLQPVEWDTPCYIPHEGLSNWLESNARFFLELEDQRLIPRGLLFDGPPGTGKTMGAKYVARTLDVPLYRYDVSSALSKWHGESEERLARTLRALDAEQPCVFLLDEVEKMFFDAGGDESGSSKRMLGQLLWWLQEHRTRVLTVMTTNNRQALPPELYRPGRIDQVLSFPLVNASKFGPVVVAMAESYGLPKGSAPEREVRKSLAEFKSLSYAGIEAEVKAAVRRYKVKSTTKGIKL